VTPARQQLLSALLARDLHVELLPKRTMTMGYSRSIKRCFRSIKAAFIRKSRVFIAGSGRIPQSCQIPLIREKYDQLGLKSDEGFFVEVGAYDGESFSNTSFLADQGWRGVYIEPIPLFYWQTRLRHMLNHVVAENVAVSDSVGSMTLSAMGPLSTLSSATAVAYESIPWARQAAQNAKEVRVPTDTLEHILERNRVPRYFELLVVDVEGHEEPIITSLLQSKWRPRVVIVELCDLHPDFAEQAELQSSARRVRDALTSQGYMPFYADSINSIFLTDQRCESSMSAEKTLPTS
jgi:FkbM family methyltransferase